MIGVLMHTDLYLDTARLGQMCRGARLAEQDFCWLVSQLGSPLYLERFLTYGFQSLPMRLRRRGKGLVCWQGVEGLSESLGRFVGQPLGLPTYFFGQSAEMVRFAARTLFSRASRVLTTDLCWPPYLLAIQQVARERAGGLCQVRLKNMVTSDLASSDDVVDHLKESYHSHGCNGLFLSDISYLGVRLPVEQLISDLHPDFVVVDGAQALHHRPVNLSRLQCDLYLTGTQKWFGAFHPLRLALVGRRENVSSIEDWARFQYIAQDTDGLFRFHEAVKKCSFPAFGSTVNLSPLICAAGALMDAERRTRYHHDSWHVLRANAEMFAYWTADCRWRPLKVHPSLGSGIVRLTAIHEPSQIRGRLRRDLARHGVVATTYDDGSVRFSMPRSYLSLHQVNEVGRALSQISLGPRPCRVFNHSQSAAMPT